MAKNLITEYKMNLISSMINHPDLVWLIDKSYIDVDGECDSAEELIYENIFPYNYIPKTQTEAKAYVLVKVDVPKTHDKMYKSVVVTIITISHQDIMKVDEKSGTRIDLMGDEIEYLFNGRDDFGFGEMDLVSNIEADINDTHRCRVIRFSVDDFNNPSCDHEN